MAKYRGRDGLVSGGGPAVGELKAWSVEITTDVAQGAAMGEDWVATAPTASKWTGTATAFFDPDDVAQGALAAGAVVMAFLDMVAGGRFIAGMVVVTSVERTAEAGGFVEVTFTFEGDGPRTRGGW